jgi:Trm5-related predicted tRNA methylase
MPRYLGQVWLASVLPRVLVDKILWDMHMDLHKRALRKQDKST